MGRGKRALTTLVAAAAMLPAVALDTHADTANALVDPRAGVEVTDVLFRDDLTRVCFTLTGMPHTSGRIDGATLDGAPAEDIDGVDFKRYYQFEEEGTIAIELDFPARTRSERLTLSLLTVAGTLTYTIIL